MPPTESLYPNETIFVFVDSSPSELFTDNLVGKTVFTLLAFPPFDRRIRPIGQYKNIRGVKRRIKTIQEFINHIKREEITVWGHAVVNEKIVVLQSAKNFLRKNKLNLIDLRLKDQINFFGYNLTYGKLLCLTWYTICLHCYGTFAIQIASAGNFSKACALLDLLPGDNSDYQNNLAIINLIKENSELKIHNLADLSTKNVARFGFGYAKGIDHNLRYDSMKSSHEFCMTDWICHSVFEKFSANGNKEIAQLADYLIGINKLKIAKAFLIEG